MRYIESERNKSERALKEILKKDGGGIYKGKPRPFVLKVPEFNLHKSVRKNAIAYFRENNIQWWSGNSEPTGHLLSSQVACINHLFFLREDESASLKILQGINPGFTKVFRDFEGGFIGFEVVSRDSYLNEVDPGKAQTRGANCTSIDAMMTGQLDGNKIQILIEWKYTESYPNSYKGDGKSGKTRKSRYNDLIADSASPFLKNTNLDQLYFEPFYQLMRQTLLGWQMTSKSHRQNELKASDWLHLDLIPENNLELRYKVPAPKLPQGNLENAWKSVLKNPEKYMMISPQELLHPILFDRKHTSMINHLNARYW